ncbi:MAG: DNA mismatch endonuclease Vsr [Rhodocyclales bacterium GT-UBC]|nr:MAG: DNA mismatch endonuclease Vsr [Rhodocyclales bacterium GT-UBC]
MTDVVDAPTRSRMMSGIRDRDTKPEMLVRKALFKAGFRFRLHRRDLPGVPDIVLPGRRVVVFVHGCFWHMHAGCLNSRIPATRSEFWREKLSRNAERDRATRESLVAAGWRVLTVWECATRDPRVLWALPDMLRCWIDGPEPSGEISRADMPQ